MTRRRKLSSALGVAGTLVLALYTGAATAQAQDRATALAGQAGESRTNASELRQLAGQWRAEAARARASSAPTLVAAIPTTAAISL